MSYPQTVSRASAATSRPRPRSGWPGAIALIALAIVPVIAGGMRLGELTGGAEVTEENARFFSSPAPVVAHIIGASVYTLLGPLQFVPALRRRRWHRYVGRVLAPLGIVAGLSGIWMAVFYSRPVDELDSPVRVLFGALMVGFIALGIRAVLRRDIAMHRAWMIRGYALGIAAGTQVLTALAYFLVSGGADPTPRMQLALLAAGWVINLVIAEVVIRRSVR